MKEKKFKDTINISNIQFKMNFSLLQLNPSL